ncbi:MAG: flagellar hook-length control protein FliK [Burkholderiaceae bacterium]|nr:flagellar hook-length control protein FliK [Burkholderiaceae bacterium]
MRPAAGEAAGEFAALFGEMMEVGLRPDLAAPAAAPGKSSPVVGLAAEVLGPSVHIITTAEPATSDESLRAFALAQGMDEEALAMIFGQPANAATLATDGSGLASDGLDAIAHGKAGGLDARPASSIQTGGSPPAAGTPASALIDLGPDASLRWTLGASVPASATLAMQAGAGEPIMPMFGLNGIRAMPAMPATPTTAPGAATDAPADHPEAANQSLAASLILGAAEAGQAARRQQLKQVAERTERLGELTQPARAAGPLLAAMTEALAADGSGTDSAPTAEPLTLDLGLDENELQSLLQQRPADGQGSAANGGNGGNNGNTGAAAAAAAERSDLDLRAEQYEKLSQRLGEALGQRLAAQIAKGDWKVEMALRPHDLGNIDIELAMKNGALEASFNASEARTRDLINDGLPRLKEVLAELGMDVASVNVNVRQDGQHGGNPTPGKQSAGVNGGAASRAAATDPAPAATPPVRWGTSSDDGLDVLV